jgi:hypothetical protein
MSKQTQPPAPAPSGEPIDVIDGIPDRTARAPWWRYALLVAVGLAWAAVLVTCWLAGGVDG